MERRKEGADTEEDSEEDSEEEEEEEDFQLYSKCRRLVTPRMPGTVHPFMRGCWKKEDWTENTSGDVEDKPGGGFIEV